MIYLFRKEMKKWHSLLWVVFVCLAVGGLSMGIGFFYADPRMAAIAKVNGNTISAKLFQQKLGIVKERIDHLRHTAQAQGLPVDLFLHLSGLGNPEQVALAACVRDTLLQLTVDSVGIQVNQDLFNESLLKSLPRYVMSADGTLDENAYRGFLAHRRLTTHEYEDTHEEEMARHAVEQLVSHSGHAPDYVLSNLYQQEHSRKKYAVVKVPFERFLEQEKKAEVSEERLMSYFKAHKENYREPERRLARYWSVTPEKFEAEVVIDDATIQQFYTKEKDGLFRVAPRVQTRRLLIRRETGADTKTDGRKRANELRAQLMGKPDDFVDAIKKHSQDTATASGGGLIDFFDKGTLDPAFERAAFRLKNTGEISPVITTKEGFELVQLVERIPASSKSLESVKGEIEETLRTKKALREMKSAVSLAIRESRDNPEAFETFAKKHSLKAHNTDWIARGETGEDEFDALLNEHMFADKRKSKAGTFTHQDDLVVFQVKETKQSFVPPFEEVRKKALNDHQEANADKKLLAAVDTMRQSFHQEKKPLEEVSKTYDLDVKTTGWLKLANGEGGDGLSFSILKQASALSNQQQLTKAREEKDYYLIGLAEIEPADPAALAGSRKRLKAQQAETGKRLSLEAFIASLQRHATIETSDKAPIRGADFGSQDFF